MGGKGFKHEVFTVLDAQDHHNKTSTVVNVFLILLICLNVLSVMLETIEPLYKEHERLFYGFEVFSVAVFTIEYLLRIWAITSEPNYSHPIKGRIKFIFTGGALIDLIAILPFYIPVFVGFDLRFIRILRLLRLLRILKITRYMHATKMIAHVYRVKKGELVITMLLIAFMIVIVSSIMYYVEHDAQPEKFSSIPTTMWWSVGTLTTAGNTDMAPVTVLGKTLGALISILGIGMVALPAGILASGFSDELKHFHEHDKQRCPHCGKEL